MIGRGATKWEVGGGEGKSSFTPTKKGVGKVLAMLKWGGVKKSLR